MSASLCSQMCYLFEISPTVCPLVLLVQMEALQSPALSVSEAVSGYSDFIENQSISGGSSSLGSGLVSGAKASLLITG